VRRFSFAPEEFAGTQPIFAGTQSISPDGRHIVYRGRTDTGVSLWIRPIGSESARELAGTEGASSFGVGWSPDSRSIVFAAFPSAELKRISIDGGDPITLTGLPGQGPFPYLGSTWSPDGGRIVFSSGLSLYEVSARGGEPTLLLDRQPGDARPYAGAPWFLPLEGSQAIVYTAAANTSDRALAVLDLTTGERRELAPGSNPAYAAEGYLIHERADIADSGLLALPFSLETLTATGDSFPIAETGSGASVAQDGTLVYLDFAGSDTGSRIVIRDRNGEIVRTADRLVFGSSGLAVSPDGRAIAFGQEGDIWVYDLDRDTHTRLTSSSGTAERAPFWPASSAELTYDARTPQSSQVMTQVADGSVPARTLMETTRGLATLDWSSDGRYLIYNAVPGPDSPSGEEGGIWYHERGPDGSLGEPTPFLLTPDSENGPQFSPDGRFVAYYSNESGRPEVYVRPFPPAAGKWQVSTEGGVVPTWSSDGSELFYFQPRQGGPGPLMTAQVSTASGFISQEPTKLFEMPDVRGARPYYVFPGGQRFAFLERARPSEGEEPRTIRVVQNWFEEFRDREQ